MAVAVVVVLVLVGLTFTDTVPSLFILYLASLYPNSLLSLSLSFFFFLWCYLFFIFWEEKKIKLFMGLLDFRELDRGLIAVEAKKD